MSDVNEDQADDLRERRVWTCKIGGRAGRLPGGADAPMRRAVADAFTAETGCPVEFCFSGWGDDLDESELAVVEDRAPDPEAIRAALVKRLTALPPEPPAPVAGDDLRERIKKAVRRGWLGSGYEMPHEHSLTWGNVADAVLAVLPTDEAMHDGEPVEQWRYDALVAELAGALAERDRMAALLDESASPVPPWPGAVLSGLTDEDGQPTWLAQAGQVRGEQVRRSRNLSWVKNNDGYGPGVWVEVRAPRAVPVPETERVSAFDAVLGSRRIRVNGKYVVTCNCLRVVDDGELWVGEFGTGYAVVAPDGTVEVLKDGDR